jgi:hypothetical protein
MTMVQQTPPPNGGGALQPGNKPAEPGFFEGLWLAFKIRFLNVFNGPEQVVKDVFEQVINNKAITNETQKMGCVNWLSTKEVRCMFESLRKNEGQPTAIKVSPRVWDAIYEKLGVLSPLYKQLSLDLLQNYGIPLSAIKIFEDYLLYSRYRRMELYNPVNENLKPYPVPPHDLFLLGHRPYKFVCNDVALMKFFDDLSGYANMNPDNKAQVIDVLKRMLFTALATEAVDVQCSDFCEKEGIKSTTRNPMTPAPEEAWIKVCKQELWDKKLPQVIEGYLQVPGSIERLQKLVKREVVDYRTVHRGEK